MRRVVAGLAVALGIIWAGQTASVHFVDVAPQAGLNAINTYGGLDKKLYILETTGNGAAIVDVDGDGLEDVFVANGTRLPDGKGTATRPQLYRNLGRGQFQDIAARSDFLAGGWAQGVCAGDYDNDGAVDLLVTYYGHNRLYRNRGNGTFEDATAKAKLPTGGTRYGSGCSFTDYDRDGKLDLFVANYVDLELEKTPHPGGGEFCEWKKIPVMCGPRGLPLAHNVLYRNQGDGTFQDVSEQTGILKPGGRYSLGVVATDFDNDGWPDIYVACDMTRSLLFHNLKNGKFEERGLEAGVAVNYDGELQAGMGIAVGDYDGDGLLDIAKTNFSGDLTSLYHNDDGKFFSDLSRDAGLSSRQLLGWGVALIDVDDDGWRDLVVANGHVYPEVEGKQLGDTYRQSTVLFRNLGGGKFQDITAEAGPGFETPRPARGLAAGDLDGDGRPELVIVNMNAAPSLLKNDGPHGHFVNVSLTGTRSNRSAIGARVIVSAAGRRMVDEVMSGTSYYSQNSLTLHFGLGTAASVDEVEVHWPSGLVQKSAKPPVDQTLKLTEAAGSGASGEARQ